RFQCGLVTTTKATINPAISGKATPVSGISNTSPAATGNARPRMPPSVGNRWTSHTPSTYTATGTATHQAAALRDTSATSSVTSTLTAMPAPTAATAANTK